MGKYLKISAIVLGALVLTTLGISASDTLQGVSGSILSQVIHTTQEVPQCEEGMQEVSVGDTRLCVDRYEASPGEECMVSNPGTTRDSDKNLAQPTCTPVSKEGAVPWRYINLSQAQRACASAGKRLPTNAEWYRSALGTPEEGDCNLNSPNAQEPRQTQAGTCKSSAGIYDMVGNVWEWVDGQVVDGAYNGQTLPAEGYVASVDVDGVALSTVSEKGTLYGDDYVWESHTGVRGMLRGGFYGGGSDGGLYTLNASVDVAFGSAGVGFRCVRSL